MIAWCQYDDCLMIVWWLSVDCPMTVWWLSDDCLMTVWWLSDDCPMTVSKLLMTVKWLYDGCKIDNILLSLNFFMYWKKNGDSKMFTIIWDLTSKTHLLEKSYLCVRLQNSKLNRILGQSLGNLALVKLPITTVNSCVKIWRIFKHAIK